MSDALASPEYRSDLGNGLVRRWSTATDEEKIGQCLAIVFRPGPDKPLNQGVINETQVMFSANFPLMGPGDWALVEDTTLPERPVVACLCCWSHCWSYGGIPFGVGRPEMVATRPEYRKRGLIRALFEMFHARSAARRVGAGNYGDRLLLPAVRLRVCAGLGWAAHDRSGGSARQEGR